jgi:hypothetical protein
VITHVDISYWIGGCCNAGNGVGSLLDATTQLEVIANVGNQIEGEPLRSNAVRVCRGCWVGVLV